MNVKCGSSKSFCLVECYKSLIVVNGVTGYVQTSILLLFLQYIVCKCTVCESSKLEVNSGTYQLFCRFFWSEISFFLSVLIDDAGFKARTTDLRSGLIAVPVGDFIVNSNCPSLGQNSDVHRC